MARLILRNKPSVIPAGQTQGRVDKVAQILASAARDGWDVPSLLALSVEAAARDLDRIHDEHGNVWDGEEALVAQAMDLDLAEIVRQLADGWRS